MRTDASLTLPTSTPEIRPPVSRVGTATTITGAPMVRPIRPPLTYGRPVARTRWKYARSLTSVGGVFCALVLTRTIPLVSIHPMPPLNSRPF